MRVTPTIMLIAISEGIRPYSTVDIPRSDVTESTPATFLEISISVDPFIFETAGPNQGVFHFLTYGIQQPHDHGKGRMGACTGSENTDTVTPYFIGSTYLHANSHI